MATPFDKGRSAARQGKPKRSNPFDHPDRQVGNSMAWEQKASEWDEGWESYDAIAEAAARSERASKAATARWRARSGDTATMPCRSRPHAQ